MVPPSLRVTSLLFAPGNRPERFAGATECGADGIIVDLEDSVAMSEKDAARASAVEYFQRVGRLGTPALTTAIRINGLRMPHGRADLDALAAAGRHPDVVVLSKVESAMEVQLAATKLPEAVRFICLIETVLGVRFASDIATASPRVVALAFGGFDLSVETGGEPTWDALLWPRSKLVHACAAAGLAALDQPFLDFADEPGLREECARTRALGFTGKLAIHPRQCAAIVEAYQPTAAQIEQARKTVAAYQAARGNAVTADGRMVDVPVYRTAMRLLRQVAARAEPSPHPLRRKRRD